MKYGIFRSLGRKKAGMLGIETMIDRGIAAPKTRSASTTDGRRGPPLRPDILLALAARSEAVGACSGAVTERGGRDRRDKGALLRCCSWAPHARRPSAHCWPMR